MLSDSIQCGRGRRYVIYAGKMKVIHAPAAVCCAVSLLLLGLVFDDDAKIFCVWLRFFMTCKPPGRSRFAMCVLLGRPSLVARHVERMVCCLSGAPIAPVAIS